MREERGDIIHGRPKVLNAVSGKTEAAFFVTGVNLQ